MYGVEWRTIYALVRMPFWRVWPAPRCEATSGINTKVILECVKERSPRQYTNYLIIQSTSYSKALPAYHHIREKIIWEENHRHCIHNNENQISKDNNSSLLYPTYTPTVIKKHKPHSRQVVHRELQTPQSCEAWIRFFLYIRPWTETSPGDGQL